MHSVLFQGWAALNCGRCGSNLVAAPRQWHELQFSVCVFPPRSLCIDEEMLWYVVIICFCWCVCFPTPDSSQMIRQYFWGVFLWPYRLSGSLVFALMKCVQVGVRVTVCCKRLSCCSVILKRTWRIDLWNVLSISKLAYQPTNPWADSRLDECFESSTWPSQILMNQLWFALRCLWQVWALAAEAGPKEAASKVTYPQLPSPIKRLESRRLDAQATSN